MLMQQHHLREANAFNGMKAVTVNRRRPLRAIAEFIILTEQIGL